MNLTQTFTHGLIGIELNRATERRDAEIRQATIISTLRRPGQVTTVRQRLGDTMIRLGARLTGEPRPTASGAHPAVDIA